MFKFIYNIYAFVKGVYLYFADSDYKDLVRDMSTCPYCRPYSLYFCDEHEEKADKILS